MIDEHTQAHSRHSSAIINEKPDANLGMRTTLHGTTMEFTLDCIALQVSSLRSFLSFHVCSVVLAMPKNKLCFGSLIMSFTGLKYFNLWNGLYFTPVCLTISSYSACACGTCPIAAIWLPRALIFYLRIFAFSPASFIESEQD